MPLYVLYVEQRFDRIGHPDRISLAIYDNKEIALEKAAQLQKESTDALLPGFVDDNTYLVRPFILNEDL